MSQHYTRNTISDQKWCNACKRFTQHEVSDGRLSNCLVCIEKIEQKHKQDLIDRRAEADLKARQGSLFA